MKERSTELVQGFRHSVPYINTHRGKTFVVMLGGEAIEHETLPISSMILGYCTALASDWLSFMVRAHKSTAI